MGVIINSVGGGGGQSQVVLGSTAGCLLTLHANLNLLAWLMFNIKIMHWSNSANRDKDLACMRD